MFKDIEFAMIEIHEVNRDPSMAFENYFPG